MPPIAACPSLQPAPTIGRVDHRQFAVVHLLRRTLQWLLISKQRGIICSVPDVDRFVAVDVAKEGTSLLTIEGRAHKTFTGCSFLPKKPTLICHSPNRLQKADFQRMIEKQMIIFNKFIHIFLCPALLCDKTWGSEHLFLNEVRLALRNLASNTFLGNAGTPSEEVDFL